MQQLAHVAISTCRCAHTYIKWALSLSGYVKRSWEKATEKQALTDFEQCVKCMAFSTTLNTFCHVTSEKTGNGWSCVEQKPETPVSVKPDLHWYYQRGTTEAAEMKTLAEAKTYAYAHFWGGQGPVGDKEFDAWNAAPEGGVKLKDIVKDATKPTDLLKLMCKGYSVQKPEELIFEQLGTAGCNTLPDGPAKPAATKR